MTNKGYTEAYNIFYFCILSENGIRLGAVFTLKMARWGNRLQAKVSNLGQRMGFTSNFYKIYWDLRIGMPVNISYF